MAAPGEIVRINVVYSASGASEMINAFWGLVDSEDSDEVLAGFIDDWVNNDWGAAWADFAADDITLVSWNADVINPNGTVKRNIGGLPVGLVGLVAGDLNPGAVAGYLLARTEFPKSRGSKYVPGVPEASTVGGHIGSAGLADLAILLLRFISFESTSLEGVLIAGILSRLLEEFREFNGSGQLTDVPAYQRRRKPSVGS